MLLVPSVRGAPDCDEGSGKCCGRSGDPAECADNDTASKGVAPQPERRSHDEMHSVCRQESAEGQQVDGTGCVEEQIDSRRDRCRPSCEVRQELPQLDAPAQRPDAVGLERDRGDQHDLHGFDRVAHHVQQHRAGDGRECEAGNARDRRASKDDDRDRIGQASYGQAAVQADGCCEHDRLEGPGCGHRLAHVTAPAHETDRP